MPKSTSPRVPSYRQHKSTGQAVVTINGRDIYLGKWNSEASRAEYDRIIAEFLANGRRLQTEADSTVVEVLNAYRKFAENYYRKGGRVTSEYGCILESLKIVRELYGRKIANDFGPLALKAVRQRMVDKGWCRGHINKSIGRIRRCFKWAVASVVRYWPLGIGKCYHTSCETKHTEATSNPEPFFVARYLLSTHFGYQLDYFSSVLTVDHLTYSLNRYGCKILPRRVDTMFWFTGKWNLPSHG